MMARKPLQIMGFALVALGAVVLAPAAAQAHCDTMDGPLVKTAQAALETGDLNPVLAWVRPDAETEVREAFRKALGVRKLGPEAREMADRFFFETVVRVHRAGEGAPYTGLKPAGTDPGPAIRAADLAAETGDLGPVHTLLASALDLGLEERFRRLRALPVPGDDVVLGREWVEAYVAFVHYVEGLHGLAAGEGEAHGAERAADSAAEGEKHGGHAH